MRSFRRPTRRPGPPPEDPAAGAAAAHEAAGLRHDDDPVDPGGVSEPPPTPVRVLRSPWPRLALFVVLGAGASWLTLTRGSNVVTATRDEIAGLGAVGVLVFVLAYAAATVALLPVSLLSAAAGVLFGPITGVVVVWCGAMIGAAASFGVGRVLSRQAVEQLVGHRIEGLNRFLDRRGLLAVLLVRLIPLFPFTLVNYGSAVTALPFVPYLTGTAAGIVPGVVVYVALGGTIDDPTSPGFLAAVAAFVVLAVGGSLVARAVGRRHATDTHSGKS